MTLIISLCSNYNIFHGRAGQPRRVGEEAHLPHRDQRLPSVLRRGVADQAGVQPHGPRRRRALQQHGAHGPGLLPTGGAHQEDPRGPAGTAEIPGISSNQNS